MSNLRSDGKAVDVVATRDGVKGELVVFDGWHGVAMTDFTDGETLAIETTEREFAFNVGEVTADKGDILYLNADGEFTDEADDGGEPATANRPVAKVTKAKNADGVVWAKLLANNV